MRSFWSLAFFLGALVFGCKSTRRDRPEPSVESSKLLSEEVAASEIRLDLFDDDERIYTFSDAFLAESREEYKQANVSTPDFSFEEDPFLVLLSLRLEEAATRKFEELNPEGLELTPNLLSAKVSVKKTLNRQAQNLHQTIVWGFQDLIGKLFFGKSGNFKEDYFQKAVAKKWSDDTYSKFDRMNALSTGVIFKNKEGKKISFQLDDAIAQSGSSVRLGMLPNAEILALIRNEVGRGRPFHLLSVVEAFELRVAREKMALEREPILEPGAIVNLMKKDRYRMQLDTTGGARSLGIEKWTQYSTPDRTMMTADILRAAVDDLAGSMRNGHPSYVHCKSGKGRSATVVVGARVALLMDAAKKAGAVLDEATINQLIREQIAQVKTARPEIGISFAQEVNLQKVLYQRAGLI